MVFENVTVDSLFATLASQQKSRKDTAVHVSLSSDLHVKQRRRLIQRHKVFCLAFGQVAMNEVKA
jgi:hypothetical protein